MWTTSICLIESNTQIQDSAGFVTDETTYIRSIPANVLDCTRSDETLANQMGYRADVIVEIDAAAYNGSGYFVDEADGTEYDIKRTFHKNRTNMIQLTGQRREHGKF